MHSRAIAIAAAGLTISAASARAPDPPAGSDADALRGPSVSTPSSAGQKTLVERDFQGRLKRLDDNPVLVALGRLELSPEQKVSVDKAVGDRAAALDTIIRDNLRLVVEYGQAEQAKDREAAGKLRVELFQKAEPFLKRGPLLGEIRPALPADKYAELRRMVDEYNRVGADDRMNDPMEGGSGGKPGEKPNRFGATIAQGFEGFGLEVKASFQRVVEAGGKEFEDFLKQLSLTPEQDAHIRQKATDLYLKTYGKPTKAQQFRLFLDIYGELDTEQRHRLAEHIGEENRARRGMKAKPIDPDGAMNKP